MSEFKTIKDKGFYEETEKRSQFISYSFPVNSEIEVCDYLKKIKAQHPSARHHVYAYILQNNNCEKYSDDGEPAGTGGLPVLNAIKSLNLKNVLVIVVRYFGGILLGTPGLRKMYCSGATNVLSTSQIVDMVECSYFVLKVDYSEHRKIKSLILSYNSKIINTNYSDIIEIEFYMEKKHVKDFETRILDILKGRNNLNFLEDIYCAV